MSLLKSINPRASGSTGRFTLRRITKNLGFRISQGFPLLDVSKRSLIGLLRSKTKKFSYRKPLYHQPKGKGKLSFLSKGPSLYIFETSMSVFLPS